MLPLFMSTVEVASDGHTTHLLDCRIATPACNSLSLQIPGVPIMYIQSHRYTIERLPEATMGGAPRN